ncbi:hypothetical protein Hypma_011005 [Hypsizygus marmoreus]|uniref:Uncharacterized protein n=1 Tax=Hypsizygus marmoreus TaxID=39966 RepID=A0A369JI99_HYPMA|nr:hypothetical protein Hypma_011005 [Hypsizygus marmoreus]
MPKIFRFLKAPPDAEQKLLTSIESTAIATTQLRDQAFESTLGDLTRVHAVDRGSRLTQAHCRDAPFNELLQSTRDASVRGREHRAQAFAAAEARWEAVYQQREAKREEIFQKEMMDREERLNEARRNRAGRAQWFAEKREELRKKGHEEREKVGRELEMMMTEFGRAMGELDELFARAQSIREKVLPEIIAKQPDISLFAEKASSTSRVPDGVQLPNPRETVGLETPNTADDTHRHPLPQDQITQIEIHGRGDSAHGRPNTSDINGSPIPQIVVVETKGVARHSLDQRVSPAPQEHAAQARAAGDVAHNTFINLNHQEHPVPQDNDPREAQHLEDRNMLPLSALGSLWRSFPDEEHDRSTPVPEDAIVQNHERVASEAPVASDVELPREVAGQEHIEGNSHDRLASVLLAQDEGLPWSSAMGTSLEVQDSQEDNVQGQSEGDQQTSNSHPLDPRPVSVASRNDIEYIGNENPAVHRHHSVEVIYADDDERGRERHAREGWEGPEGARQEAALQDPNVGDRRLYDKGAANVVELEPIKSLLQVVDESYSDGVLVHENWKSDYQEQETQWDTEFEDEGYFYTAAEKTRDEVFDADSRMRDEAFKDDKELYELRASQQTTAGIRAWSRRNNMFTVQIDRAIALFMLSTKEEIAKSAAFDSAEDHELEMMKARLENLVEVHRIKFEAARQSRNKAFENLLPLGITGPALAPTSLRIRSPGASLPRRVAPPVVPALAPTDAAIRVFNHLRSQPPILHRGPAENEGRVQEASAPRPGNFGVADSEHDNALPQNQSAETVNIQQGSSSSRQSGSISASNTSDGRVRPMNSFSAQTTGLRESGLVSASNPPDGRRYGGSKVIPIPPTNSRWALAKIQKKFSKLQHKLRHHVEDLLDQISSEFKYHSSKRRTKFLIGEARRQGTFEEAQRERTAKAAHAERVLEHKFLGFLRHCERDFLEKEDERAESFTRVEGQQDTCFTMEGLIKADELFLQWQEKIRHDFFSSEYRRELVVRDLQREMTRNVYAVIQAAKDNYAADEKLREAWLAEMIANSRTTRPV